jgi:tetratricopeptide (TPR) repeat protein
MPHQDYDKAIRDYAEALRHEPGRTEVLFARGTARYSTADYQGAAEDLSMAIDLGAAEASVFYLRGLAYQGLRKNASKRGKSRGC